MPSLRHPPPAAVHGLLSVKRGGQFSKRVRRLAHLEHATLELRVQETDPVEWSASLIDAAVHGDESSFCITLVSPAFRLRLYAHSHVKYAMWLRALRDSALWKLHNFYDVCPDQILGEGHFAVVYKATDRRSNRVVAVKHIRAALAPAAPDHHPYLAQLVARECRISRLVSHPSIVNVRDVFDAPDTVYIVMDHLPYTLHDVMKLHTHVTEAQAAAVTSQLLSAISYLHGKNIVHRDIKPDNILCEDTSAPLAVKICDFGMSNFPGKRVDVPAGRNTSDAALIPKRLRSTEQKLSAGDENEFGPFSRPIHLSHLTQVARERPKKKSTIGFHSARDAALDPDNVLKESDTENTPKFGSAIDGLTLTSAIGAPSYVAPELVKGHRYGKPVDVWGVGVILFYMLCGYLPFEGSDAIEVVQKIRACKPDFSSGSWLRVSDGAKRFVQMLMHPDPRKRITADSALENEWLVKQCS